MSTTRMYPLLFGVLVLCISCQIFGSSQGAIDETLPALPDHETQELMLKSVACKPHPRQIEWQENEFIAFVHFGVNTFTAREWGNGKEDPALFRPEKLDTDQWCEAMKVAGMKLVIFTAKHHDGFCLWPTRYTTHSTAASPWRNGKGDPLKDLATSCRKFDLKLGVYLSPADLHQIENPAGLYGNQSSYSMRTIPRAVHGRSFADKRTFNFNVDDYNEYFMNQLFELLTEYGPIHEVWFDGAHPKRKGGQQYRYRQWYEMIRKLAPDAVIAIKGPDVRWCGNEAGLTRKAEWSVVPVKGAEENWRWPDMTAKDLGSLDKMKAVLKSGGFLHWYPAETNTSLRHGWFYRDESQVVKTVDEILDIWRRSVGGNTVFLLNVPPDRDGRLPERDVAVLKEVGRVIKTTFGNNLARGSHASASKVRKEGFEADNILDNNADTCWMPPDWTLSAEVIVNLPSPRTFNLVLLKEQVREYSQRIAEFAIDAFIDGEWKQVADGTTVGFKRICRTKNVTTDQVRIRIIDSRVCPTICSFGLYFEASR